MNRNKDGHPKISAIKQERWRGYGQIQYGPAEYKSLWEGVKKLDFFRGHVTNKNSNVFKQNVKQICLIKINSVFSPLV